MRAFSRVQSLIFQAAPDRPSAPARLPELAPCQLLAFETANWLPGFPRAGPSTPLDEFPGCNHGNRSIVGFFCQKPGDDWGDVDRSARAKPRYRTALASHPPTMTLQRPTRSATDPAKVMAGLRRLPSRFAVSAGDIMARKVLAAKFPHSGVENRTKRRVDKSAH